MAAWLLICCALVFTMVVVGGVTRLTHSGLSIVEWQPIVGTLPPVNDAQWLEAFDKYKLTPEYRQVNHGMSVAEFKSIFWWEYFHRLLGRLIGVVFLLPLLWFWFRKRIDRPLALKLAGIFALGGLQGAMGWYMVKSGLVDDPRVSQYRLAAHLGLAFVLFGLMFWTGLGMLQPRTAKFAVSPAPTFTHRLGNWLVALVFIMVLSGALVAGIRAGLAYNTFPLMNGHLLPPEMFLLDPWYLNFFSNMATVQFDHRLGAWLLAFVVPWFWMQSRREALPPRARLAIHLLLGMLALQIGLGIATLLLVVPVPLAAAHQGGAVLLLGAALLANHSLR
ncbi:MAG: COX15/CtaA family protein [Betaproteobacteria bacterium]|nr:COX15/CtaA family protein [Betaproteobacteria bacterium]